MLIYVVNIFDSQNYGCRDEDWIDDDSIEEQALTKKEIRGNKNRNENTSTSPVSFLDDEQINAMKGLNRKYISFISCILILLQESSMFPLILLRLQVQL
jgi:hypothetical protein